MNGLYKPSPKGSWMALALPHYSIISLEWENDQVIQGQDIDNL